MPRLSLFNYSIVRVVPAVERGECLNAGVILFCRANAYTPSQAPTGDWRSFNLSRWQAEQAMAKAQPYLQGYSINKDRYPMRVHTPDSQGYFECQNYYGD